MHEFEIRINELSKIEGHANLDIKVKDGTVEEAKLKISENKRFFSQAVRGTNFKNVHQMVSRICGTCSMAHLTCCIKAVENAVGVTPSEQTVILRKLAMYGSMIRDHAMHLYIFCLPDMVGKDSIMDFDESQTELVKQAFQVKGAGNNLAKLIGGKAVHAPYPQIGGFAAFPEKEKTKKLIDELKSVREHVIKLIDIFYNCNFDFRRKTRFIALSNDDYNFIEGLLCSSDGLCILERDFWDHLNRVVIPYSQATGFEFEGREYTVGSLARMNINRENLHKETQKDAGKYLSVFPSENIFHNNLAQEIEILHSIDHSIELLETKDFKEEPTPEVKPREGDGIGVIEAPRGTLYYLISIKNDGKVRYANLVIPTAQNQISIEKDIKKLVQDNLEKGKEYLEFEIEKLIRAYDPCMSCAAHFLKVKWIR